MDTNKIDAIINHYDRLIRTTKMEIREGIL